MKKRKGTSLRKIVSKAQEKKVAKEIGGRVVAGSGASMYSKGDVENRDILVECKTTARPNITVKGEWLEKIYMEALDKRKTPALSIELRGKTGIAPQDWVLIPLNVFSELVERGCFEKDKT